MTLVYAAPDLEAFRRRMYRLNFERIEGAMRNLAPDTHEYTSRMHLPMFDGSVGVQFPGRHPGVGYEQTAQMQVLFSPALARIAIGDIRTDARGEVIRSNSLRFLGRTTLTAVNNQPLDGFAVEISPDGGHVLTGIIGGHDVSLLGTTIEHADEFAVPLIIALERRSGT